MTVLTIYIGTNCAWKENGYFIIVYECIGPIIMIKPIAYTGHDKWLKVISSYRKITPKMAGVKEQIFAKMRKHSYMAMSAVSFNLIFKQDLTV